MLMPRDVFKINYFCLVNQISPGVIQAGSTVKARNIYLRARKGRHTWTDEIEGWDADIRYN